MPNSRFKKILLMGRAGVKGIFETLTSLQQFLLSQHFDIVIEENTAKLMDEQVHTVISSEKLSKDIDLIIVVGGDGSLLAAAQLAIQNHLPVLGINRGRLGFLTDIYPDELETIREVLNGHYQEEYRFLLKTAIQFENQTLFEGTALNDVVMQNGTSPQMIEFETYINDRFVYNQRADGLIVATPTGSTAYALSGGGPILHPKLNAIALVPMFPHTLSSRPIVVEADTRIEIRISKENEMAAYCSCDGQQRIETPPGSCITISKHKELLRLIHPDNYSYFATLREKLGWEQHHTSEKHSGEKH